MQINLVTPFAEKDAVKALGARWDGARKVWYLLDVEDLTPFRKWIPNANVTAQDTTDLAPKLAKTGVVTQSAVTKVPCGCDALPWDDCAHTLKT